jgi:hypothetical protein
VERVKFEIKVYDNFIEIIPEGGVKDNSVYEIRLKNLTELEGSREFESQTLKLTTALTPSYATVDSIQSLIEGCKVPTGSILYHIREASKLAAFIKGAIKIDSNNVPYEIEQFVRYQAAHDSLIRFYIDKAASSGVKGQLGDVSFEDTSKVKDISGLLKDMQLKINEWKDAIRGYKLEGRAKPVSALRGSTATTPLTPLNTDFNRGV